MPRMGGLELLSLIKNKDKLSGIPVIVLTTDQESEVVSLNTGASDFIPKPYPQPDVVKARVRKSIELSEERQIISETQNDPMTGLFTGEYFYEYAELFDKYHPDVQMDAIVLGINNYQVVLERYGKQKCIELLHHIADGIRSQYPENECILCHKDVDVFFIYCHHIDSHEGRLQKIAEAVDLECSGIRMEMGIYSCVDKNIDISKRFGDFQKAIKEEQFKVFFQPKFGIAGDEPQIAGAEALVRWFHPELNLISPGLFIPLFESNGLIYKLDDYIWHKTCAQIRKWREQYDRKIPVSVNISRVEMHDPNLSNRLIRIVEENGIEISDLHLEITESAYVSDSSVIIERVEDLRRKGFFIEMDDFGSGYSSLNMIGNLPIDALKLDMQFLRNAFNKRNMKIIDIVLEIARCLEVPAIAEGVETEEQYLKLKESGCAIIQGYYFSKPIPADEFEKYYKD